MTTSLSTPETLAGIFGVSREYVMSRARTHAWPHLRVGRNVRFTDEHVEQIVAMTTVAPAPETQHANEWGRKTRRAS